MSTLPKTFITPEEYLAIERAAEYKSEYFEGEMFAMAGAPEAHDLIGSDVRRLLGNVFADRNCRIYSPDMRVQTVATHYSYPDASAVCGEPRFADRRRDTLLNPSLIVEVLSPSTQAYDRGRKFKLYKAIPSLREYLLLASDRIHAELYSRQAGERWLRNSYDVPGDLLKLTSIDCELRLADLYAKVGFPK